MGSCFEETISGEEPAFHCATVRVSSACCQLVSGIRKKVARGRATLSKASAYEGAGSLLLAGW